MPRRRRRMPLHLRPASGSRPPGRVATGVRALRRRLRRPKRMNPRPRDSKPTRQRPSRQPRMRPRRSVVDRLRVDEPAAPRTVLRLRVVAVLIGAVFALMFIRLWYLQVINTSSYKNTVVANQVRTEPTPALRGLIVDRNGHVLVGDGVSEDITVDRLTAAAHPEVVTRLATLLDEPVAQVTAALNNLQYSPLLPAPVAQGATIEQITYVKEHRSLFPGVTVQAVSLRTYPYRDMAAQVLGYVKSIDAAELNGPDKNKGYTAQSQIGKAGLEAEYEAALRGSPGSERLQVNAQGVPSPTPLSTMPATPGDDVVTNLDAGLQQTLESALGNEIATLRRTVDPKTGKPYPATSGAAVVLDPRDGSVLAMASLPTYDPSWWVGGISEAHYKALTSTAANDPQLERAVNGIYPPGSTFKLATATAALQRGLITPETTIADPGYFQIPGACTGVGCRLTDNESEAQAAPINVTQALTVSSDVFFYNLGYDFWQARSTYGPQPVQTAAAQYGYGQPTGIDFPEDNLSRVDSPAERAKLHQENPKAFPYDTWSVGDNLEMAFGQGESIITPLQQAVAYATFANGGTRYAPRLAAGIVSPSGKVVQRFGPVVTGHVSLPPSVSGPILQGLEGAVDDVNGTAGPGPQHNGPFVGFPLSRFPLAVKTGTASVAKGEEPDAWIVVFGPEPDPGYVVAIVIAQGGFGATSAGPVARQVFDYLLAHPVGPVQLAPPPPPTPPPPPSTTTTTKPGATTTTTAGATRGATTTTGGATTSTSVQSGP